jgi:hypothetical protein
MLRSVFILTPLFMKGFRSHQFVKILILLIFSFCGCDFGRYYPPTNPSLGTLRAKMNGQEWNETYKHAYQVVQCAIVPPSTALPCNDDRLDLLSELYSPEGYLRQKLYFIKIPRLKGRYQIVPSVYLHCNEQDPVYGELYTLNQDGDVVGDVYNTLEGADNYFQIDKIDNQTQEIKGSFQLTLVMEKRGDESRLPDTLRFTDGKFHAKILDIYIR